MHYARWRLRGSPLADKPAKCPKGGAERYLREVALSYDGDECLIWPFRRDKKGYGALNGRIVSRMVCVGTYGAPPTPEHQAAQSCGNGHGGCVAKRHLRWATALENAADKIFHSRIMRGRKSTCSKLTESNVRQIRRMIATHSQGELGRLFGVGQPHIHKIINRTTWAWLD